MRVIAGRAKGRRLKAPSGLNTRPLTDMIKESLFNVLGTGITDSIFLDLFAGSGSVGIEALSRNAQEVVFIDNSPEAVKIIRENLENCGFIEGSQVYRNDVFKAIEILRRKGLKFDYIYVDPPFSNDAIFEKIVKALDKAEILSDQGIMIIRTRRQKKLPSELSIIEEYRINDYGESTLHYYHLNKERQRNDGNI